MNLRLAKDSIRFRLALSEAQALFQKGELTERLPWGENGLTLKVQAVTQERLSMNPFRENCLEFFVPNSGLEGLLTNAEQKGAKDTLELKGEALMNDQRIEIRFEIDHFSRGQNSKQKSKPNQ